MAFGVVIATDRHHHLVGIHLAGTGAEAITLPLALQSLDTDPLTHINIQVGGKAAHVVDDGVAHHETLRVVAVVGKSGNRHCQLGVTRQKLSQRWCCQAWPMRFFSSTRAWMPWRFRQAAMARPA